MILDQNRAVLVASVICFQKIFGLHGLNHQIIEYLVSRGRYWLVLGVTGSEQGGTGFRKDSFVASGAGDFAKLVCYQFLADTM